MQSILLSAMMLLPGQPSLQIQPADVTLTGPQARSASSSSNRQGPGRRRPHRPIGVLLLDPKIATIDETGLVKAVGDGETAHHRPRGDSSASIKVKVTKTTEPAGQLPQPCHPGADEARLQLRGLPRRPRRQGRLEAVAARLRPGGRPLRAHPPGLGRPRRSQEPAKSLMLLKPTLAVPHGGGLKLEVGSPDYRVLADWIAVGAPAAEGRRRTRSSAWKSSRRRRAEAEGRSCRSVVRAWYCDGHAEDVTRWAKFTSSEDLVAGVDEDGRSRSTGHGEAAIAVCSRNLVASCASPRRCRTTSIRRSSPQSPRHNFIDDLVLKKLRALHIPPSPRAPTTSSSAGPSSTPPASCRRRRRCRTFLADRSPGQAGEADRRAAGAAGVRRLLGVQVVRPAAVSSRKLPQPAVWAFYQYIRQSVADNKPWDRFAREILTARGSTSTTGRPTTSCCTRTSPT